MSLDLAPIIEGGFAQANVFLVGFAGVLMLVFGIGLFKWIFGMLRNIFSNLGGT